MQQAGWQNRIDPEEVERLVRTCVLRLLVRGFGRPAAPHAVFQEAERVGLVREAVEAALERLRQQGDAVRVAGGWRLRTGLGPQLGHFGL